MNDGDTVVVIADTEDNGAIGVIRGEATITIGRRAIVYKIVHFADGHEGAYEANELRAVPDT